MVLNSPLPTDLASECHKAAKTLRSFVDPGSGIDHFIPPGILSRAKGLAIFTVVKAGFLFSGRAGSGLVVARTSSGDWSAPSAIGTGGIGFGGQIGAEITDFVIVLNSSDAVRAFSVGGNVTLGGNLSVAAGPIGRTAEAAGTVSNLAPIFSYSKSKGLFAGVSIEGSVIVERTDANEKFYGRRITARELLSGDVPPPREAETLYEQLRLRTAAVEKPPGTMRVAGGVPPLVKPKPKWGHATVTGASAGAPMVGSKPLVRPTSMHSTAFQPPLPPSAPVHLDETAVALYDFSGVQEGDLSFQAGDTIRLLRKTESVNDWWTGELRGNQGAFPANYVQMNT